MSQPESVRKPRPAPVRHGPKHRRRHSANSVGANSVGEGSVIKLIRKRVEERKGSNRHESKRMTFKERKQRNSLSQVINDPVTENNIIRMIRERVLTRKCSNTKGANTKGANTKGANTKGANTKGANTHESKRMTLKERKERNGRSQSLNDASIYRPKPGARSDTSLDEELEHVFKRFTGSQSDRRKKTSKVRC
jgi:hypothetical protein